MGIVYLLTHEAMPNLTKIGRTDRQIEDRLRELNNTSVPFAFRCFYAAEVNDAADVERRLHDAFKDSHVGKEFFELHPYRAQRVLEMVATRDVTPRDDLPEEDPERDPIANPRRTHLRRFSMARIGLKPGEILQFIKNPSITATVHSDTEVLYNGQVLSLSKAALLAVHQCGYNWKTIPGPETWLYRDQPLKEIEQELLAQEES
jgi:hypothetical protein